MSESTVSSRQRFLVQRGPWIGLGLAVAIMAFGAWLRRHTLDDSFINYRIIRQIQAGNGPVFNAGERVESFTSALWLAIVGVADVLLPVQLEWIGMTGGILMGLVGLVFAAFGARALHRVDAPEAPGESDDPDAIDVLVPLGALVAAVFPPIYRLIATGLEDGLSIAWLGASVWVLGTWARSERRFGLGAAFLIGLGVLVRPDMAPFCAAFLGAVLIGDRRAGWRHGAAVVAAAVALPLVTVMLRMGYFGVLTPTTAIAKSAHLARWGRGWDYLVDTVVPYGFWIPALVIVAAGYVPLLRRLRSPDASESDRRRALVAGAFGLGAALCTLYIVRLGGDYMQTRLLLPALFGFLAPMTFVHWRVRRRAGLGHVLAAVTLVWLVVCGFVLRTASDDREVLFEPQNAVTLEQFAAAAPGPIVPESLAPGSVHYMQELLPYRGARGDTPILVELGVGKVGFAAGEDVYVLDGLGLANPIAAHLELRGRGWPGHEKLLPQPWIAALATAPGSDVQPEDVPRPPELVNDGERVVFPRNDDPAGRSFAERVATARGVLACDRMARFVDSYQAPLTWRQFASNLRHAVGHHRLVIPGEPADAAEALCSPAEQARVAELAAAAR